MIRRLIVLLKFVEISQFWLTVCAVGATFRLGSAATLSLQAPAGSYLIIGEESSTERGNRVKYILRRQRSTHL
jgi:hypothetical protein